LPRSIADRRNPDGGKTIVLGIDPGTLVTGYGVVAASGSSFQLLASGTILNRRDTPLPARLGAIYTGLLEVISRHHPHEVAIETAFYGKNAQSALKLGQARGVSILAAVLHSLPLSEYAPREIKKAVTGNGNASKDQVQYMVRALLQPRPTSMKLDTSDAIATAICHLSRRPAAAQRHTDWKAYIEAHPERIRR
jgi:crossover junction endodeoxyribonuclease RuvC